MRLGSLYFKVAGAVGIGDCRLLVEAFFDDVNAAIDEQCALSQENANCKDELQGSVRDGPPLVMAGNTVEPDV